MNDFTQRFRAVADARLKRALAALATDPAVVAHELHSLAGEAAMLGLIEISATASDGSKLAAAWKTSPPTNEQRLASARLLRSLMAMVAKLGAAKPVEATRAASAPTRSALIIDDSALVAEELAEGMESAGFVTAIASSFDAVVTSVQTRAPDVVLLDANIPGVDVREVRAYVRQHAPAAKLIVVSGAPDGELQRFASELQADGYASKLDGVSRVLERVNAVMRRERT